MANRERYGFDETKFKPKQREAALALVEKEFTDKGHRKSNQQIADELGITRMTLYNWNNKDRNFIRYKRYLSDDFMDSQVAFVYSKLLDSIDKGSVRGIELFMKRMGDLANKQEISFSTQGENQSFEDRRKELMERLEDAQKDGE